MRLTKDDKRKQESDKANLIPGGLDADLGLAPVAGVQPAEAELVDATEVVKLASRDEPADQRRSNPPRSIHPDKQPGGKARRTIGLRTSLAVAVMTCLIGFAVGTRLQNLSVTQLDYTSLGDVYNALSAKYDGSIDRSKLLVGAAKGLVDAVGDKYTSYMTAKEYADLETDLSGELNGIGVEIGLGNDGLVSVISTLDDSPARKAGLLPGDIIEKVDGDDMTGQSTSVVANRIRGKVGTTVKIVVVRNRAEKSFQITRTKIENPSVKWSIKDGIGYIRVSTFGDDTGALAEKAAKDLVGKKVKGVVLDLRSNTGGYVNAAQELASLWLKQGELITTERAGNKILGKVTASGGDILSKVPTVVLIDGATASSSEITAGALRDKVGAKLVGTKSYGKGLVQEIVDLKNGDKLKVTIAKWYTPNGDNINQAGLKPDIEVKMTAQQYNAGNDTQLKKALEVLAGK